MGCASRAETSEILTELEHEGHPLAAQILPQVYDQLHLLAEVCLREERPDHTLQPTALIHEAYLKLANGKQVQWQNRAHFFGVAARAMREVLIDYARKKGTAKRGGGWRRLTLGDDFGERVPSEIEVADLDRLLSRLGEMDPRAEQVVELRVFGGLTARETAHLLGVSERTVHNDWRFARAWLSRELTDQADS